MYEVPRGGSSGGNTQHLAPEVRAAVAASARVPYAKQQPFETGCIWAFIAFGIYPLRESDDSLLALPPVDSHGYPAAFMPLLLSMLSRSPESRPALLTCVETLHAMDELEQLRTTVALEPERTRMAIMAAIAVKEDELVWGDFPQNTSSLACCGVVYQCVCAVGVAICLICASNDAV